MFLACLAGHFFSLEVFYDKNVALKVKNVSEKTSKFKVLGSDTFKVFYAIFPYILYHFDRFISIQMVQIESAGWTLKLSLNFWNSSKWAFQMSYTSKFKQTKLSSPSPSWWILKQTAPGYANTNIVVCGSFNHMAWISIDWLT